MYIDLYSEEITKKFSKLKKKDTQQYSIIQNKISSILKNPKHRYKYLHNTMKGINRIHIGAFVLIFIINHKEKNNLIRRL